MQSANDNQRPAWYDQKLTEYLPFIRKLANKAYPRSPDDLVQDVTVLALRKWQSYSDDYKFGTWLVQLTRNAVSDRKQAASRKKRTAVLVAIDRGGFDDSKHVASNPNQHDYVELSQVLRRLSGTRDSDVLMRIAMGDELGEIGADYGISRERVRQLGERERKRLVRVAA